MSTTVTSIQDNEPLFGINGLCLNKYLELLNSLPSEYSISESLNVLKQCHTLIQENRMSSLDSADWLFLGGIDDKSARAKYQLNTHLLGDMSGNAGFKKILKRETSELVRLLNTIPGQGTIDGWHYLQFVQKYEDLCTSNGIKKPTVFPATRLLAIKRPDVFVALNQATSAKLCEFLSIPPFKTNDFKRYWDNIILWLQGQLWNQASSGSESENSVPSQFRCALMSRLLVNLDTEERHKFGLVQSTSLRESNSLGTQGASTDIINVLTVDKKTVSSTTAKQPKQMTIKQKVSSKINKSAATKLMSQYYFANKATYGSIDMKVHRESIITRLVKGEAVDLIFADILKAASTKIERPA